MQRLMHTMRFFSGKKSKKQQYDSPTDRKAEKGGSNSNTKVAKAPATNDGDGFVSMQTSKQQPQRAAVGANLNTNASPSSQARSTSLATVAEYPKQTQSTVSSYNRSRPVTKTAPSLDKYYQHKETTAQASNHTTSFAKDPYSDTSATPVGNVGSNKTNFRPEKTTPRSILHAPHDHTQQPVYTMEEPEIIHRPNRVRFLSSNSSAASSSCASEVHLMAGPSSVASSSAMSSSKGDAENVFDRVLHSVMAEEEDRLKAMGMSKAGLSSGMSPSMCYKSNESPGMYYRGGVRGVTSWSSDELSPRHRPTKPAGMSKITSAGQLIDIDTGMRVDESCKSGNFESQHHDLHKDEAIDTQKYRQLLSQSLESNHVNDSVTSIDSDRALNGSMNELRLQSQQRHVRK